MAFAQDSPFGADTVVGDSPPGEVASEPPQDDVPVGGKLQGIPGLPDGGFGIGDAGVLPGEEATFEATYVLVKGTTTGTVSVRAIIAPGWHIYSTTQPQAGLAPQRSELSFPKDSPVQVTGDFVPDEPAVSHESKVYDVPEEYHEGAVTWTAPIRVPDGFDPAKASFLIEFSGQVCKRSCIPLNEEIPVIFNEYVDAVVVPDAKPATTAAKPALPPAEPLSMGMFLQIICLGLLGGLILNLMPCVLPVIGLKIFGFVEQSGKKASRILALNLWYTFGMVLVFMILATAAVFLNLAWGEQFTHTWFKVGLICLVFAMALSFLGVWEIPLPGFVGAGASVDLQQKEGAAGAFFKGVFTTILATPCSGPLLGPLFGYTLGQPPYVTYLIFASIGLGMASPYLIIGAFPGAVKFLPKPGAWMETFKQVMGFVLLGTVVFLFIPLSSAYFIATLTLLFAIWFACWLIGRTPITAEASRRVGAWLGGVAFASVVGWCAFTFLTPQRELLEWRDYSEVALQKAQQEGKTVMVDFTADWCPTCKWNLKFAINTKAVQKVVEENGVVPMIADWTEPSDEIENKLAELRSRSIPVLAIYPSGRPEEVIILRDVVSRDQVVEALVKAGSSKVAAQPQPGGGANLATIP